MEEDKLREYFDEEGNHIDLYQGFRVMQDDKLRE